jgi:hypothetical protein
VTVQVIGDTAVESDETFFVNLSGAANATIGDGQGTGIIVNDDVTPPPSASITVTAPNGGESWRINRNQNLRWTSAGVSGNVRIRLSRSSGVWEVLFASTPNDGRQNWRATGPATTSALLEICSVSSPSVCDVSNSMFTIRP